MVREMEGERGREIEREGREREKEIIIKKEKKMKEKGLKKQNN